VSSPVATIPSNDALLLGNDRDRHHSGVQQAPVENQPHHGKQSMQSTVSALHRSTFGSSGGGSGSAFADFGLRRRKSTGGGTANSKSGRFGKEKESKDGGKDRKEKARLSTSGQGGVRVFLLLLPFSTT